jgi:hypothetical protein
MAAARRTKAVSPPARGRKVQGLRATKRIPRAAVEAAREALRAARPNYSTRNLVQDLFEIITEKRRGRVSWDEIGRIVSKNAPLSTRTLQKHYYDELAARKLAAVAAASDRISTMLRSGQSWPQIHKALPHLAPDATRLRTLYNDAVGKPIRAAR